MTLLDSLKYFTHQDLVVFFIAFCVGVMFVCLVEDSPEVIVRWPTPDNAGLVTYVDRANNCYEYVPKEVECTDSAKNIPIQKGEGMVGQQSDLSANVVAPKKSWEESFV